MNGIVPGCLFEKNKCGCHKLLRKTVAVKCKRICGNNFAYKVQKNSGKITLLQAGATGLLTQGLALRF